MTETNEPLPTPEGDEVWDKIEADEEKPETVEVTKQELDELGEFLSALRAITISNTERIENIEAFLQAVAGVDNSEVETGEGEGSGTEVPSGEQSTTIVDGSGKPLNSGGTDVPGDDS